MFDMSLQPYHDQDQNYRRLSSKTGESELAYDPELVSQDLLEKSFDEITSMYSASDEM